jgi:hypothetical protein
MSVPQKEVLDRHLLHPIGDENEEEPVALVGRISFLSIVYLRNWILLCKEIPTVSPISDSQTGQFPILTGMHSEKLQKFL